jgi:hypothetical protein
MGRTWLPVILSVLLAQSSVAKDDSTAKEAASEKRDRLLQTYTTSAAEYTIHRDATRREKIELQRGPVYVWTDPVRQAYRRAVDDWRQEIELECRKRAIDRIELTTEEPPDKALLDYLVRRAKTF